MSALTKQAGGQFSEASEIHGNSEAVEGAQPENSEKKDSGEAPGVIPGSPVPEEERGKIRVEEKEQEGGADPKPPSAEKLGGRKGPSMTSSEKETKGGKDESHKRVGIILDVMMLATDNDQALELVIDAIVPLYVRGKKNPE